MYFSIPKKHKIYFFSIELDRDRFDFDLFQFLQICISLFFFHSHCQTNVICWITWHFIKQNVYMTLILIKKSVSFLTKKNDPIRALLSKTQVAGRPAVTSEKTSARITERTLRVQKPAFVSF